MMTFPQRDSWCSDFCIFLTLKCCISSKHSDIIIQWQPEETENAVFKWLFQLLQKEMLCNPPVPIRKAKKNKVSFCIMCSLSFSLSNINIYFKIWKMIVKNDKYANMKSGRKKILFPGCCVSMLVWQQLILHSVCRRAIPIPQVDK